MVTTNGLKVPYGVLDPQEPGMAIRYVFQFATGRRQEYQGVSGDGSARNVTQMQTVFVDNAANAFPIKIECFGTGHTFSVPSNSQGFFPVFCPENAFALYAIAPQDGAADVPILLAQKPMDLFVWKVQ